jgi:hypothetical protein
MRSVFMRVVSPFQIAALMREVDEIEPAAVAGRAAGDLSLPGRGEHDLAGELDVQRRPQINGVALPRLRRQTVVGAIDFRLAAERHLRRDAVGEAGARAQRRGVGPGLAGRAGDVGRVDQIDGGVEAVRNQLGVGDGAEGRRKIRHRLAEIVDARPFRLRDQREADRRAGPAADHEIAQLRRKAAEGQPGGVRGAGHAVDVVAERVRAELVAEILRRHVLVFDFLLQRAVDAAAPAPLRRRLELDRLLALGADVGALGEAEQIFGLEFVVGVDGGRRGVCERGRRGHERRRAYRSCRPACPSHCFTPSRR